MHISIILFYIMLNILPCEQLDYVVTYAYEVDKLTGGHIMKCQTHGVDFSCFDLDIVESRCLKPEWMDGIIEQGYGFKKFAFKSYRWGRSNLQKEELYELLAYSERRAKMCEANFQLEAWTNSSMM
jgi:hypothetical protein